jgi:hypothetical protein
MAKLIITNEDNTFTRQHNKCLIRFDQNKHQVLVIPNFIDYEFSKGEPPRSIRLSSILRKDH